MSSIRAQIIAALVTRLNTGTPGGVPATIRSRTVPESVSSSLESIAVYPVREVPERVHVRALTRSKLTLAFEVRAVGSDSVTPDESADDSLEWIVKSVAGYLIPSGQEYLNLDTEEGETTWDYQQGEYPLVIATINMDVVYQHLVADAAARA